MGAGNSQSRPVLKYVPQSLSIDPQYIGSEGECFFRNEYFLSPFAINSNWVEFNTDLVRVHRPDDLVNLLAGCYEQLNSIPEILETLIQLNFSHDHVLIAALDDSFRGYTKMALFRASVLNFVKKMERRKSADLRELRGKSGQKGNRMITAAEILDVIKDGLAGEDKNTRFESIASSYGDITPAFCMPPPVPMFWGNDIGHADIISGRAVVPHGICSNGKFLFVLCVGGFLKISPLMNSGSLMKMLSHNLKTNFDYRCSLIATEETVEIFSGSNRHVFKIVDLLGGVVSPETRGDVGEFGCCMSDGVVAVRLNLDLSVVVMRNGKVVKRVKLQPGNAELHPGVPVLLPQTNYDYIPIFTNGSFLTFVFRDGNSSVLRVFSLLTGKHVGDQVIQSPEFLYAVTYDTFNRCQWVVSLNDSSQLVVKKYYSPGSVNPFLFHMRTKGHSDSAFDEMLSRVNSVYLHYLGSHLVPSSCILPSVVAVRGAIELAISQAGSSESHLAIQVLVSIIDINLGQFSPDSKTRDCLLELVQVLPNSLAFVLFFEHLDFVMLEHTESALELLVKLVERAASCGMLSYVLQRLELCDAFAKIPFGCENCFTNLVLTNDLSFGHEALLLSHQRQLFTLTLLALKQEQVALDENGTDLESFEVYSNAMFSMLSKSIETSESFEVIEKATITKLMFNFFNLSSALVEYHVIARILVQFCSQILNQIQGLLTNDGIHILDDRYISMVVRFFLFLFGKITATILKGRSLTDFEQKFSWLIESNRDTADDSLLSTEILFEDQKMNDFFHERDNASMEKIYRVWKWALNRHVTETLKETDRLVILTLCHHMDLLDELFSPGNTISPELRQCLDCMMKIRNEVGVRIQRGEDYKGFWNRTLMLQRMKTPKGVTPKDLCEFICCHEDPASILSMITQQRTIASCTAHGFSIMYQALTQKANPFIINIFSYTFSQVTSFKHLGTTILINRELSSKDSYMAKLFTQILHLIKTDSSGRLTLASFRFFRDCDVADVRKRFLTGVAELFFTPRRNEDKGLFALILSMAKTLTELPAGVIKDVDKSRMGWLVIAVALENVQADKHFYREFRSIFRQSQLNMERIFCRVMFHVLNSKNLSADTVKSELKDMVTKIGTCFLEFKEAQLVNACEMIWVLRRILIERTRARPILMSILESATMEERELVTGVFAVLGGNLECVRPYCNVKYHINRSTVMDFIAIPTNDQKNKFICYPRPFEFRAPPQRKVVDKGVTVYAVPLLSLTPQSFDNFDFILSFFMDVFSDLSSATALLYVQLLAHYVTFREFVEKLTPQMISVLWKEPLPFQRINNFISLISVMPKVPTSPECGPFYTMSYAGVPNVSYCSPQLNSTAVVTVSYHVTPKEGVSATQEPLGYFGIVSDNVERCFTRYTLVATPHGVHYPNREYLERLESSLEGTFQVDVSRKVFLYGKTKVQFPIGDKFRIIIAYPRQYDLSIQVSGCNRPFSTRGVPTVSRVGGTQTCNMSPLFTMPSHLSACTKPQNSEDERALRDLMVPIPDKEKLALNFVEPPSWISIHPGFATHASKGLIDSMILGLFKTLALQYTTVCLMRIVKQKPEHARDPAMLFALMIVPLERFSLTLFEAKKCPINFSTPVWEDSNHLYMSFDNDAKECIAAMLQNKDVRIRISEGVFKMTESRYLHLLCVPHAHHVYIPKYANNACIPVHTKLGILTLSCFKPFARVLMADGHDEILPMILADGPTEKKFGKQIMGHDLSILQLSDLDNSFAFDSAFEVLLLLKNLTFVAQTPEERGALKSAFVNLFIAQSPFVFPYLSSCAHFLSRRMPAIPSDLSVKYRKRLFVMNAYLKDRTYSPHFEIFVKEEQRVWDDATISKLAAYFPEFGNTKLDPPESNLCKIPVVSLDPGTIQSDFDSHINTLAVLSQRSNDLVGFPFWLILPYWLRVSDAWTSGISMDDKSHAKPIVEYMGGMIQIFNPGSHMASFQLHYKTHEHFSPESILIISPTPMFDNADFVVGREIGREFRLGPRKKVFLSLVDTNGGWRNVSITLRCKERPPPPPEEINMDLIHKAFVADMYDFVVRWSDKDTQELNFLLPGHALRERAFSTVQEIAEGSSLSNRFPPTVVVLKALLFHHYNFLRWNRFKEIQQCLWIDTDTLLSWEMAANGFIGKIRVNRKGPLARFRINRSLAMSLIADGRGDPSDSIISQLTKVFAKIPHGCLQCLIGNKQWEVQFKGEKAVDVGGPGRELMTEAASSIFHPTTKLVVPTPNRHRHEGKHADAFIPFDPTGQRLADYKTIGQFIGIILRGRLPQYLPFAPLVWKYLTQKKIREKDVMEVDDALQKHFNHIREAAARPDFDTICQFRWTVEQWDRTTVVLPGHSGETFVRGYEVEQYIKEYVQWRISSLKPTLKAIRDGFRLNVGIGKDDPVWNLLTGPLLSRMAQGSGEIPIDRLKAITCYRDYTGESDPTIVLFWKAVASFDNEQLKLLLKFITALTRLPNVTTAADFQITIDRLEPRRSPVDETLPTAATCFNTLHLPAYSTKEVCYQKLLYAITYCQTLENT